MGKFENKFLSLLKEDEFGAATPDVAPAVDAEPGDDQQSFANALDEPEHAKDFEDVIDQNPNEQQELSDLQEWIGNIDEVLQYLNGGISSVLGKLRNDNKVGTIFADVSDATKSEILDVCERLASLNQIFKNLYIEKHK
jgi:peptidoglycan hydrolase CwlO-like protein|tara:strand:+ start:202 stop:618 length:417 start_codon:yes stop_codon:yes gene_type:complete